jgi:leucyl/phenylalanyl-tRNA--protein transferase
MMRAYELLHDDGWAHSIEIWNNGNLAGGLYGICIGKVFFGESMFSNEPNTSKMALLGLARHMLAARLELIDCQVVSRHLVTLGARLMPRTEFVVFLERACNPAERYEDWPCEPLPIADLCVA